MKLMSVGDVARELGVRPVQVTQLFYDIGLNVHLGNLEARLLQASGASLAGTERHLTLVRPTPHQHGDMRKFRITMLHDSTFY